MSASRPWNAEEANEIIARHRDRPGALLPMLRALQDAFGYMDEAAIPEIASALNISRAEVHGVITFYHDFHTTPGGTHVLKVCRAEACQSMGCNALVDHLEKSLGVQLGNTTTDGSVTLEAVYCLGNCALSPAAMLDGKLYGRVSPQRAEQLLADARRRA
ncbi:MAG TPA: formate dehydrogenase subunit gamma [Magnetospirillaceae bacterium]|jgi:formate dehydrogenase subunit gamma